MTSVGENIKNIRKKNNITQEELAEKLNVTRQAVSNWENGKTEPDIKTLSSIAAIFETSTDRLINYTPKEKETFIKINPRLLLSTTLLALSIVSILVILSLEPIIATQEVPLVSIPLFLNRTFKSFCSISFIYGALLFISMFKNIIIKNAKTKKTLLIIGSIGLGTFIITSIFFIAYTITSDNLFYTYPNLFYLRSPKFIQIIFQIFEFLSENIILNTLFSFMFFLGLNKYPKIEKFDRSDIKTITYCAFLVFSIASLLSFEIISPSLKAYVSSCYDYSVYYLIVGFWKPVAIVLGTFGILRLILDYLNLEIKNKIIRRIILAVSIVLLAIIFISNLITFVIMIYVFETSNGISTNLMRPAFFIMQHQILYTIPAILLSLGLSKKTI